MCIRLGAWIHFMERGAAAIVDFPRRVSHSLEGARGYLQQDESSTPWITPQQGQELELCASVTCFFGFPLHLAAHISFDKPSPKLRMPWCPWGVWLRAAGSQELPGHISQQQGQGHRLLLLPPASALWLGLMLCPFSHPVVFPG